MPTQKQMVHVYLTKKEKERIWRRAQKLGISLSSYIKVMLFKEELEDGR